MAYNSFIEKSITPETFEYQHKLFALYIVQLLTMDINDNFDLPSHPFRKFDIYNRNNCVRTIDHYIFNQNINGNQGIFIDYFRSNSIYHEWLHELLDAYEDYAVHLGF